MTFTPHGSILKHQKGEQTDIFGWLQSIQPDMPFYNARETLPLSEAPALPIAPLMPEKVPNGPVNPEAVCPQTGRRLSLYIMRDLSCAILRDRKDGGHPDVLPASLCLTSQVHSAPGMKLGYLERAERAGKFSLYARPDGLYWKTHLCKISEQEICDMISIDMVSMSASIIAADPIVDPRAHANTPERSRFAPFSRWPEIDIDDPGLVRLERLVRALTELHIAKFDNPLSGITIMNYLPQTPWQQGSAGRAIWGNASLAEMIKEALKQNPDMVNQNILYGPPNQQILRISDPEKPASSHETLARIRIISQLAPQLDISYLL
jgi:hypothetical protein